MSLMLSLCMLLTAMPLAGVAKSEFGGCMLSCDGGDIMGQPASQPKLVIIIGATGVHCRQRIIEDTTTWFPDSIMP